MVSVSSLYLCLDRRYALHDALRKCGCVPTLWRFSVLKSLLPHSDNRASEDAGGKQTCPRHFIIVRLLLLLVITIISIAIAKNPRPVDDIVIVVSITIPLSSSSSS